jgi:hypothetical protein
MPVGIIPALIGIVSALLTLPKTAETLDINQYLWISSRYVTR